MSEPVPEPVQEPTGPTGTTEPVPEPVQEPTGPTGTTEPVPEPTGPTGTTEPTPTESTGPTGLMPTAPEPEPPLAIEDLLNDVAVLQQKEAADKSALDAIGGLSLRGKLVTWATLGFPNAWTVHEVAVVPPSQCSDGVSRSLADYIQFVSGKTLAEHVATLQTRVTGITVSYAWTGSAILIVVTKA